jgi:hypothetical protein
MIVEAFNAVVTRAAVGEAFDGDEIAGFDIGNPFANFGNWAA